MNTTGESWQDADDPSDEKRRMLITTSAIGATAAVGATYPLVQTMTPSERARAFGAPVEVSLTSLRPGQLVTETWRGKPIWILNRSKSMLDSLSENALALVDPYSSNSQQPDYASNDYRSIQPEYFVAVAICTHLGCIPSYRPEPGDTSFADDWPGGFFCPCHGSKFDLAGRVYKNVPAPTNLEIPPYRFNSALSIVVG